MRPAQWYQGIPILLIDMIGYYYSLLVFFIDVKCGYDLRQKLNNSV